MVLVPDAGCWGLLLGLVVVSVDPRCAGGNDAVDGLNGDRWLGQVVCSRNSSSVLNVGVVLVPPMLIARMGMGDR